MAGSERSGVLALRQKLRFVSTLDRQLSSVY